MSFTKLTPLDGRPNPCLCCPPILAKAPLDKIIAVGFGSAIATKDGKMVADGENGILFKDGKRTTPEDWIYFSDIEDLAATDPDHDWRIALHGPMHGELYQRQGKEEWILVQKDEGFA